MPKAAQGAVADAAPAGRGAVPDWAGQFENYALEGLSRPTAAATAPAATPADATAPIAPIAPVAPMVTTNTTSTSNTGTPTTKTSTTQGAPTIGPAPSSSTGAVPEWLSQLAAIYGPRPQGTVPQARSGATIMAGLEPYRQDAQRPMAYATGTPGYNETQERAPRQPTGYGPNTGAGAGTNFDFKNVLPAAPTGPISPEAMTFLHGIFGGMLPGGAPSAPVPVSGGPIAPDAMTFLRGIFGSRIPA